MAHAVLKQLGLQRSHWIWCSAATNLTRASLSSTLFAVFCSNVDDMCDKAAKWCVERIARRQQQGIMSFRCLLFVDSIELLSLVAEKTRKVATGATIHTIHGK